MTPTETTTLADFLLAMIAEDEAVARADGSQHWRYWLAEGGKHGMIQADPDEDGRVWSWNIAQGFTAEEHADDGHPDVTGYSALFGAPILEPSAAEHIARHDPARVLAECEAKRRIVAWCGPREHEAPGTEASSATARFVLRVLALPYADRPDYREEWKP